MFREFISPLTLLKNSNEGFLEINGAFEAFDTSIIAIIAVRDNHISLLFVDKSHHRRGIGKLLVAGFVNSMDNSEFEYISVNSSPHGKEFYLALGFTEFEKEKMEDGIIFTPMRLKLV